MITSLSIFISLICLTTAWSCGFYTLRYSENTWNRALLGLSLLGLAAEAVLLVQYIAPTQTNNFGFFNSLAFTTWLIAIPCMLIAQRQHNLLIPLFSLPLTLITLLMMLLWGNSNDITAQANWSAGITYHVIFSIGAYTLLALGAMQALLLLLSQRWLHQRQLAVWRFKLPPLETQDHWLFAFIGAGWMLLSIALISGFLFVDDLFAQHLVHKTLFSCLAWGVFATLLFGRRKFGWRGKTAIYFTFSGFLILLLGYFGSQFVLEVILHRK
jgi:ABC-type uncharacterized transport system permease subunit|tara:strand:- start:1626 stop:2435 length:810 start_codon:yes stop_codon:yes gene_type:complete